MNNGFLLGPAFCSREGPVFGRLIREIAKYFVETEINQIGPFDDNLTLNLKDVA